MTKRGHKVTVVCPGTRTEIVKEDGYKIIRVKSHPIKLYEDMMICLKSPDYLDTLEDFSNYNLIHLQANMSMSALGYFVALKYDIPVSCTYHTNIADFIANFFDKDVLNLKPNPIYKLISNRFLLSLSKNWVNKKIWDLTKHFHNAVPTTRRESNKIPIELIVFLSLFLFLNYSFIKAR